ncbi:MAG: class I SAM-dependent methyltransferase [Myxococcaceae bacterium]
MKHPLATTTTSKILRSEELRAREGAERLGLPYVQRKEKQALAPMLASSSDAFLVYDGLGVVLRDAQGELRFTPGMSHLRVEQYEAGRRDDLLLKYAELREGDTFLDCTLGLASDSLFAARAVGRGGRVVGVESSKVIFSVISEGLREFDYPELSARIEPVHARASEYLASLGTASFDVVFFDPMFERPGKSTSEFSMLRRYADHSPLTLEVFAQARRVAKRWVLVKGSRYSQDLRKLGIVQLRVSRSATVMYGRVAGDTCPVT